ncbi:hypothetical protein ANCCAN_16309 [Ancylostoma caninum]|uniref:Uncharacterized protein n=1 Tax=Ancylostoma caninum TaxID=29170 RepID=A0A368G494_ANCCA|nr:hypothetical protein ANCCAN_16309 [Ancylostoma caninum]
MKSRKRSNSTKLDAKRALEKEARILVPWSLDLDDDASASDIEQGTRTLNISAPSKSLDNEDEANSEGTDKEMKSEDSDVDDEEVTANADKESFLDSEEEENMEVADVPSSSKDDDYQKEFKVLGQTEFQPLKKIKYVTLS